MRIWDVPPSELCRKHLLGEHRDLHGLWNIITLGRVGYSHHPETKRWVGKSAALYARHEKLVAEMQRRCYNHQSALEISLAVGHPVQDEFVNTIDEQRQLLRNMPCPCYTS